MNNNKEKNSFSNNIVEGHDENVNRLVLVRPSAVDIEEFGLKINPEQFRKFMSSKAWLWFRRGFIKPYYAYEFGLRAASVLLDYANKYSKHYTDQQNKNHLSSLYSFVLDMLDKLDEWESYVTLWQQLHEKYGYNLYGRTLEKNKSKLRKFHDGKRIKNMIHYKQCTTPPEELKQHLQSLFKSLPELIKKDERVPF